MRDLRRGVRPWLGARIAKYLAGAPAENCEISFFPFVWRNNPLSFWDKKAI
jgi:hypothetical protein